MIIPKKMLRTDKILHAWSDFGALSNEMSRGDQWSLLNLSDQWSFFVVRRNFYGSLITCSKFHPNPSNIQRVIQNSKLRHVKDSHVEKIVTWKFSGKLRIGLAF